MEKLSLQRLENGIHRQDKVIQQKDTNIYQIACHHGYWLTINDDGEIVMLKKHQLIQDKRQNWYLEYISKQEMKRKVPVMEKNEMKQTQSQIKQNDEIIQNILNKENQYKNNNETLNEKHMKIKN